MLVYINMIQTHDRPHLNTENNVEYSIEEYSQMLRDLESRLISYEEMADLYEGYRILEESYLKYGKLIPEQESLLRDMESKRKSQIVVAPNLSEYKKLLLAGGLDEQQAEDIVAHENAHANVAEQEGWQFEGYGIRVGYDSVGGIIYSPCALLKHYFDEKPDQYLQKVIAITVAPEVYSNELSPSDKAVLGRYRRILNDKK